MIAYRSTFMLTAVDGSHLGFLCRRRGWEMKLPRYLYDNLYGMSNRGKKMLHVSPSSSLNKEQLNAGAADANGRVAQRLATLHHLDAIRPEADHVLQQLVDEVRSIFGT